MEWSRPYIMGILNLTPDSFSDGGKFNTSDLAIRRIEGLIAQGVDLIDVGAESTGPGSQDVSEAEEMRRIHSVVDLVTAQKWTESIIFSIDTYKSAVAEYALQHGFKMVNDVTALRGDPKMVDVLLKYQPYIVLMYSKDASPRTTLEPLEYDDVIVTISQFLQERAQVLIKAGFPQEKIILDPGMGAFVSAIGSYSFEIIERLQELKILGYPLMVGISRKGCLGGKLEDRDQPSVEWSLKAIQNGADIIRIHDVEGMKKALRS